MLNIPVTKPLSSGDTQFLNDVMDDLHKVGILAGIREYTDKKGNYVREIWRQATPMDKPKKRVDYQKTNEDNYGGVILPDSEIPPLHEFIRYNMKLIDVE